MDEHPSLEECLIPLKLLLPKELARPSFVFASLEAHPVILQAVIVKGKQRCWNVFGKIVLFLLQLLICKMRSPWEQRLASYYAYGIPCKTCWRAHWMILSLIQTVFSSVYGRFSSKWLGCFQKWNPSSQCGYLPQLRWVKRIYLWYWMQYQKNKQCLFIWKAEWQTGKKKFPSASSLPKWLKQPGPG